MKNTRGEPSAGGQTAPREALPISCLFVLFRSLRVVRAANIVTMNSPSCGGRGMAFSHPAPQTALWPSPLPACIHVTKTKSVDMAPEAQLSSAMSIDMAPGRSRFFAAKNRCLLCSGGMSIDVPLAE